FTLMPVDPVPHQIHEEFFPGIRSKMNQVAGAIKMKAIDSVGFTETANSVFSFQDRMIPCSEMIARAQTGQPSPYNQEFCFHVPPLLCHHSSTRRYFVDKKRMIS